jgi:Carboxypeptidase regulatory-like domain
MQENHRPSARYVSGIAYILLLPLTGPSLLPAQTPPDPSVTECSVKGTVTDAVTGARLRKVYVRLEPTSEKGTAYPTVTNDQGEFVIRNVAPGAFRLSAEKQGYLDGSYGGDADTPRYRIRVELRLTAGQNLSDLHIALTPQATVSGRILDDDGDPWNQATAIIYRSVSRKGKRELDRVDDENADDRGVFRIAQLPPGQYYLAAEPDTDWEDRNLPASVPHHQTTWYPSSPEAGTATPIGLTAGESRDDIEIRLRRGSFFHIRGSVTGLDRIPPSRLPHDRPERWQLRVRPGGV